MNFYMPTKVYFGKDVVSRFGKEVTKYGKKPLIVTGQTSAIKSGVLDDLLPILNEHDIKYVIFNNVEENPDILSIEKGRDAFLGNSVSKGINETMTSDNSCDFIIAVGGGSPLDAGKAISLMTANNLCAHDIYNSTLHKKGFPIIAIPTTSGTGSEVTPYSVLSNNESKLKAGFGNELMFPKLALLDPKYTLSLSKTVTRDTAIDALSHLLEGLYSNKYNQFLLPLIYTGVKIIYENLSECLKNLDEITFRQNLMLASNYGGIVIAHTSTTLQHSIGYPLTTEFGLSHGLANGVVMKEIIDMYEPHIKNRIDGLFQFVNISKKQFLDWLESFDMKFEKIIDDDFIQKRVPEVMSSRNMMLNPCTVSSDDIINIYRKISH